MGQSLLRYCRGFQMQMGPSRVGTEWQKPLRKFMQRAQEWSSLNLGLHLNARVYNMFLVPLLSYIWQLCEMSQEVFACEAKVLSQFSSAPVNWRTACDLYNLDSLMRFPIAFRNLRLSAWASRLRLHAQIARDLRQLASKLHNAQVNCVQLSRLVTWRVWNARAGRRSHSMCTLIPNNGTMQPSYMSCYNSGMRICNVFAADWQRICSGFAMCIFFAADLQQICNGFALSLQRICNVRLPRLFSGCEACAMSLLRICNCKCNGPCITEV